jgi:hypothetical protein
LLTAVRALRVVHGRMNGFRTLLCLLLLVPVAACGGGAGEAADAGPEVPGPIALADLAAVIRQASCVREVRCGLFADEASCVGANYPGYFDDNVPAFAAAVAAGRARYDAVAAAACRDGLANQACGDSAIFPPSCAAVIVGLVADGGTCFRGEDCASDDCAIPQCGAGECCAGTCKPNVVLGGDCSLGRCVAGSFCDDGLSGTGTCVAVHAEGGTCRFSGECTAGLTCSVDGVCTRYPQLGEACTGRCDRVDNYCDGTTSTCTPKRAVGAACTQFECLDLAACVAGTCQARPGLGEACAATSAGPLCLADTYCDSATLRCVLTPHSTAPVCP